MPRVESNRRPAHIMLINKIKYKAKKLLGLDKKEPYDHPPGVAVSYHGKRTIARK